MKLVFIINSIQNQRCIKRINEFVEHGYDVIAYAFNRGEELYNQPNFDLNIMAIFSNTLPYKDRIGIIFNSIKSVISNHKKEKVIYYLFGLDIAMVYKLFSNNPYIYEESDLAHTYVNNKFLRFALDKIDKYIIRRSLLTVFTSEGFKYYHFGTKSYDNLVLIPNKLHSDVLKYKPHISDTCIDKLKIGFVGFIRYDSVYFFAKTFLTYFPNHEFHFYGDLEEAYRDKFENLKKYTRCYFHGRFRTPEDLSSIYSNIDMVLSTYDIKYENVKYAEPNKLYEAIYFEKPIIVTKSTFLAKKINNLKIGFAIDPLNENEIIDFIRNISLNDIIEKSNNARLISKIECINCNDYFFEKLNSRIFYYK